MSPKTGHIALAGAPNVGKSTLLNALVGQHLAIVSPKAQATRLPVTGIRTDGDTQYIFHDLPGLLDPAYLLQTRMRQLALDTAARMDLVLHLHPAADAPAPPFEQLAGLKAPITVPILTVYTKGDLLSPQHRSAVEAEECREAERTIYIRVTLFVERESQKAIVIGRGGQTIKAIGAHARRRLEELIGAPVYLDSWVKALPNWRKSQGALTRFGFPATPPAAVATQEQPIAPTSPE